MQIKIIDIAALRVFHKRCTEEKGEEEQDSDFFFFCGDAKDRTSDKGEIARRGRAAGRFIFMHSRAPPPDGGHVPWTSPRDGDRKIRGAGHCSCIGRIN